MTRLISMNRLSSPNILELLVGVNMFQKFRVKQLRQWVFFDATWHWHLGTAQNIGSPSTGVCSSYLYQKTQIAQVGKVQRTAARWTCRRWRNTSSVGDMLDELERPSLEARREQSSLTFFYKRFTPLQCLLTKLSIPDHGSKH